ncbi:glyoxylate reductase/hydroxypyruvate reductase [Aplysia californica]|uniref:Glyoxylate reductase/hydroxypyruvate reductase n=1 Tax=Aplysia californica TaxID=6500 RepID=A0ABM0K4C0_APLCA|nr:glyoxylate reductase/hydroxypyruvate reductase [Aplysia californica]
MSGSTVFISKTIPLRGLERLKENCQVKLREDETPIPLEEYKRSVVGMDALFIHPPAPINKEILDLAGPQLKVVGTMSVGLDHVDLEECRRRGVKVGYTPEVLTKAVAEMTVGLTLATARRYEEAMRSVHNGVWGTRWENALWMAGQQISDSVVGIVGLGRIGLAVARRLKAFEPSRILYCGNSPKQGGVDIGAEFVSFEELLSASDFVIATCAISEKTKGLFNESAFKQMKNNAVFINVTRGVLVDQEALFQALTTNQIAAAGLDVTTPEPLPTNHKLLSLPNCTVTPHLGSATSSTRNAMCDLTVDNILAGLRGQQLPSPAC